MKLIHHIQEASANLYASKLRSLLALLGILVGTASVVAMVSAGELAMNETIKQFKALGTDLLSVSINSSPDVSEEAGSLNTLTLSQARNILTADPHLVDVAPYTEIYNTMQFNGHPLNGNALGVTDSFSRIAHITLTKGRFISILDGYSFFCVIGNKVNEQIKKMTQLDAIGQQIQMGDNIFTIVGIANAWAENDFIYTDIDYSVMIPILTATAISQSAKIKNILFRLTPDAAIEPIQDHITSYVNKIVSNKKLSFRSAKALIARMSKQSQIFTLFLGLIGSISLLVGGIGVMNIMLVSVVERRREIGIRLAVGAKRWDIQHLFLVEAVMLSVVGGVTGVLFGLLITYLMAFFWHWEFMIFLLPPLVGFLVSVGIGIFFGYYPAYKASQLNPIDALRSE